MGTEIFKIDAEMAEKIEVEVGNPHLKSDRKTENSVLKEPTSTSIFSAITASILKISVPINKRRS